MRTSRTWALSDIIGASRFENGILMARIDNEGHRTLPVHVEYSQLKAV